MDASELRAIAKEREARRGVPEPAPALPWGAKRVTSAPPSDISRALLSMHRSIRLARGVGFAAGLLAGLCALFGAGRLTIGLLSLGGLGLARGGGVLLHGLLPTMLIEVAKPPTSAELAAAASIGLFSAQALASFGPSLHAEYALALDSLAFACTYGKKKCARPLPLALCPCPCLLAC